MTRKEICRKCVTAARDRAIEQHIITADVLSDGYNRCLKMADGVFCVFLSNRVFIDTVITESDNKLFLDDGCQYRLELLMAEQSC